MEQAWWPDGREIGVCACGASVRWVSGVYFDLEYNVMVLGVRLHACDNPKCWRTESVIGADADVAKRMLVALAQRRGEPEPGQPEAWARRPAGWRPVDTAVMVLPTAHPEIMQDTGTIWDQTNQK